MFVLKGSLDAAFPEEDSSRAGTPADFATHCAPTHKTTKERVSEPPKHAHAAQKHIILYRNPCLLPMNSAAVLSCSRVNSFCCRSSHSCATSFISCANRQPQYASSAAPRQQPPSHARMARHSTSVCSHSAAFSAVYSAAFSDSTASRNSACTMRMCTDICWCVYLERIQNLQHTPQRHHVNASATRSVLHRCCAYSRWWYTNSSKMSVCTRTGLALNEL